MPLLEKPKGKRSLKCSHCNTYELWSDREAMMKLEVKGKKFIFVHAICYKAYLTVQEEKLKEVENGKLLYKYIREIHDTQSIPQQFIYAIEILRLGGKVKKLTYRGIIDESDINKGFTYKEILEAYRMSESQWKKAKSKISFDYAISEFNYCLKIVQQNLIYVINKMNEQEELEAYGEMFGWKLKKTTNN